jgi:tight adherence protein B
MRRLWLPIGLVVAFGAIVAGAAAASTPLRLTEAGAHFPFRSYVLTLPGWRQLQPAAVTVTENGVRVSDLTVTPVSAARRGSFGVVLAVDASSSMAGRPIKAAFAAARTFATHRASTQELAIVSFNALPRVILPFTADANKISAALESRPRLAYGTHLFGAVATAVGMLQRAHIASGSVVVLSDGADTGSASSEKAAAAAARAAHVRVFTIGFRSRTFDAKALARLAADTGGTFSEAGSAKELARIYDSLGLQLSREYLLQYRSLAGPGETVDVAVTVEGLSQAVASGYTTPPLPTMATAPYRESFSYRLWRSPLALVVVALVAAALFGGGIVVMTRPPTRTLQKRIADFVSIYVPAEEAKRSGGITDLVFAQAERSFERSSSWRRFDEQLEIAEINLSPMQIVAGTIAVTVVAMALIVEITHYPLFSLFGLLVPVVVRGLIKRKLDKKRRTFASQLSDTLQLLASALRAGHGLVGALAVVASDSAEPTRSEFRRAVADEQLGVPLDDALDRVARRMDNGDLEQVAVVAALQRESGGNTAEVLDRVAEVVRERAELRQLVRTLTAQGRLTRWILTLLPAFLAGIIAILNPAYLAPLVHHTIGRVIILVAAVMVVTGSLVIKRIIDIKV